MRAKELLVKYFQENVDYRVKKAAFSKEKAGLNLDKSGKNLGGAGLNKEKIFLNVHCFKKLCLKARTKKAEMEI